MGSAAGNPYIDGDLIVKNYGFLQFPSNSVNKKEFPTAMIVGFQSLGRGVVHHFLFGNRSASLEPWNLMGSMAPAIRDAKEQ